MPITSTRPGPLPGIWPRKKHASSGRMVPLLSLLGPFGLAAGDLGPHRLPIQSLDGKIVGGAGALEAKADAHPRPQLDNDSPGLAPAVDRGSGLAADGLG